MYKPLKGTLVVSLEQAVAAPLCSSRMADAGARVIKIERPEGDFAREYDHVVRGGSAYFVWLNHGKESVALDLKQAADLELLKMMLKRADVLVENLKPGALQRLGLDLDDIRKKNPGMISCGISGFGKQGPYSNRKSYDLLIQAESGLASVTGTEQTMGRVGVTICFIACGRDAYEAVLEALIGRTRNGKGRSISISIFDVMAEMMTVPLLHFDYGDSAPKRVGLRHPSIAPYGVFETEDGTAVLIGIQNEREWKQFCKIVMQAPEAADDPKFESNILRVENRDSLDGLIADVFAGKPIEDMIRRREESETAFGILNEMPGLSRHPHLRRFIIETEYGPVRLPMPAPWSDIPSGVNSRVPELGEHTSKIREEFGAA